MIGPEKWNLHFLHVILASETDTGELLLSYNRATNASRSGYKAWPL